MKNSTYISVVIIFVFGMLSLFSIAENSMDLSPDTSKVSQDTSTTPLDTQDTSTTPLDTQDTSTTPQDTSKVSQDTSTTPQDSQDTSTKSDAQINETLNIARNISGVKILLNKTNKTDINTGVYFNSTTKKWNVEFSDVNKTINISVVINDTDKRVLEIKSYPPISWTRIKNRELINAVSSQPAAMNFMKMHANASLNMNYDRLMDQWHATILSKDSTEKLRIVIDNDAKKVIHTKILSTLKPAISTGELEALVKNKPGINEFIVNCKKTPDCGEIKIKRWYDKEKGLWVVSIYGNCKNCKKIIFIDGQTGSIVENKRVFDKVRSLNLIKSMEIIKSFMRNHPDAKINTIYDETSNQWYVTISYSIGLGEVKEITVIVNRETGVIVSVDEWEYSRDKFK